MKEIRENSIVFYSANESVHIAMQAHRKGVVSKATWDNSFLVLPNFLD